MAKRSRLTIVQYSGDFAEAANRLREGGPETYGGQRYTVDYIESLTKKLTSVITVVGLTDEQYDVVLPSGARAIGAGLKVFDAHEIVDLVARTEPDILILRTPSRPLIRWAIRNRCRTLLLLADSINFRSLKSRLGGTLLSWYCRSPVVEIVANHGLRSAEQLVSTGVSAKKVFAWDYPAFDTPEARPVKRTASADKRILFVGMLVAEKGVHDLIGAAQILQNQGIKVHVDLVGKGDEDLIKNDITRRGLSDRVSLVGPVPNAEIIPRMAAADIVVVPSHHEYSEGLPKTIFEAFCSRTPLIVSDHPMFKGTISHEKSGLVFKAGNPALLAAQINRLLNDHKIYEELSENSLQAWRDMQIPVKWHMLIDNWLEDSAASRGWLATHSLAASQAASDEDVC